MAILPLVKAIEMTGCRNHQQPAIGIDGNVPFAPDNLLACIVFLAIWAIRSRLSCVHMKSLNQTDAPYATPQRFFKQSL